MKVLLIFLLALWFIGNEIISVRRHSKKRFNGFKNHGVRKNIISALPKEDTKFLDIILNRAVTEIIDSISNSEKRKQIASRNEKIFDLNVLPSKLRKNLQNSIRTVKKTWKNSNTWFDPFDGGNDPYNEGNGDVHDVSRNQNLISMITSIPNNGASEFTSKKQGPEMEKKLKKEDLHYKYQKTSEKSTYFAEPQKIDEEQVSEILPVDGGSLMLLKDGLNNDEIKLDVPNMEFDVKLNSSNDRDNIARNLKNVLHFMNTLKFKQDGETENDTGYISKNESLLVGQKRGGAMDDKKLSSGLDNISLSEISKEPPADLKKLLPKKPSYFMDKGGDLYRIEKVQLSASDEKPDLTNTSSLIKKPIDQQLIEKERPSNETEMKDGIDPPKQSGAAQQIPNLLKSGEEVKTPTTADVSENSFIIKHGVQVYKVVQTNGNQPNENSKKKENEYTSQINDDNTSVGGKENPENPALFEGNLTKEIPTSKTDDDTYEIKHNNKIFRITEIKNKSRSPSIRTITNLPTESHNNEPSSISDSAGHTVPKMDNIASNKSNDNNEILSPDNVATMSHDRDEKKLKSDNSALYHNEHDQSMVEDEHASQFSDVPTSSNASNDDEDVTYVFTTENNALNDNRESFNNTLYQAVTP